MILCQGESNWLGRDFCQLFRRQRAKHRVSSAHPPLSLSKPCLSPSSSFELQSCPTGHIGDQPWQLRTNTDGPTIKTKQNRGREETGAKLDQHHRKRTNSGRHQQAPGSNCYSGSGGTLPTTHLEFFLWSRDQLPI